MRASGAFAVLTIAAAIGLVYPAIPADAVPASRLRPTIASSRQFASYALAPAPATVSASTTLVVPKVAGCPSTSTGVDAAVLVTTGSGATASASAGDVFLSCNHGQPHFGLGFLLNGARTSFLDPAPGDTIVLGVSVTSTKVMVGIYDRTKGFAKIVSGPGAVGVKVFLGMFAVTGTGPLEPIPNFGAMSFGSASIDGSTPAAVHAVATNMKNRTGTLQIATSPLGAAGNSWTENFKHS